MIVIVEFYILFFGFYESVYDGFLDSELVVMFFDD